MRISHGSHDLWAVSIRWEGYILKKVNDPEPKDRLMTKYELIERTSCAGCDVQITGPAAKKVETLFKELKGSVGYTSDKSVQLLFSTEWQRDRFEREASALGVIFDSHARSTPI